MSESKSVGGFQAECDKGSTWEGDIPKDTVEHDGRVVRAWIDFRGGIHVYADYFWHWEEMSTINDVLIEPVWLSLASTKRSCILGCDPSMELQFMGHKHAASRSRSCNTGCRRYGRDIPIDRRRRSCDEELRLFLGDHRCGGCGT